MSNLDNIDLTQFLRGLEEYHKYCSMRAQETEYMSAVFNDSNTTEENITLILAENLPSISELHIPIISKEDSENVFAISTLSQRMLNELAARGEMSEKYSKHVEIKMHCIELIQKLKLLRLAQDEIIRIFFMNRFKILTEIQGKITTKITYHSLRNFSVLDEIQRNLLKKSKTLIDDINLVYMN